jgi:hypothetical protein
VEEDEWKLRELDERVWKYEFEVVESFISKKMFEFKY